MPQFGPDELRRVGRVVRRAELAPRDRDPDPNGTRPGWVAKVFLVTTAITAGNGGDTPGVGKGTMCLFNRSTKKFVATARTNIDLYSMAGIGIIVGAYVQFVQLDGEWFYDVTKCGNGASSS